MHENDFQFMCIVKEQADFPLGALGNALTKETPY